MFDSARLRPGAGWLAAVACVTALGLLLRVWHLDRRGLLGHDEAVHLFEAACRGLRLPVWVLLPNSPKLNGGVGRTNRTHREECMRWRRWG